jgi:hypothetical protein
MIQPTQYRAPSNALTRWYPMTMFLHGHREATLDRIVDRRTSSDDSNPSGATVSGGWDISIQFRVWKLNCPVNLLINRAFMYVVVMGTTEGALYLVD